MNIRSSKLMVVAGLFLLTLVWVGLMGLIASAGRPTTSLGDDGPFEDDGTLTAEVTNLDRENFHLTMSLKVTGPDGKSFGGLGQDDLRIEEDGKEVEPSTFIPGGQAPLRVCLCIDYSKSMNGKKINGAKKAALAMLDMLRDHHDQLAVYAFMGPSKDGYELLPIGPLTPERRQQAAEAIENTPLALQTPMLANMNRALKAMENVMGRRVMIVLTDGKDTTKGAETTIKPKIIEAAQAQKIPLYMIALEGARPNPRAKQKRRPSNDDEGMKALADATNGQFLNAPSADDLKDIYLSIGAALQEEYTIEWDSPRPVEDGSTRNVVVTVRSGPKGTQAQTEYRVPGVVATGAASTPSEEGEESSREPTFAIIFLPLALLLAGLLVAPMYLWRPRA